METESYIVLSILYWGWELRHLPKLTDKGWRLHLRAAILVNELCFFILISSCYIAVMWWKSSPPLGIIIACLGWFLKERIYRTRGLK